MGVGVSLVLIAIGAIFTFAITASMPGVNLGAVGVILMVVGTAGLLISLLFWETYAPFSGWRTRRNVTTEHIVHDVDH
jgi:membrane-bound ClpP family serine protease